MLMRVTQIILCEQKAANMSWDLSQKGKDTMPVNLKSVSSMVPFLLVYSKDWCEEVRKSSQDINIYL